MKRSGMKLFLSFPAAICVIAVLLNSKQVMFVGFLLLGFYFVFRLLYKALTSSASSQAPRPSTNVRPNTTGVVSVRQSQDTPRAANGTPARWVPSDEWLALLSYRIPGGLFYFGEVLPAIVRWEMTEPALINPHLQVNVQAPDYGGSRITYWPSYSSIPAECRAAYLDWLAGGRTLPSIAIGYVFLFFYGLERRVLHDFKNGHCGNEEVLQIILEVKRLLALYGSNGSFRGYARRFLEIASIIAHADIPLAVEADPAAEYGQYQPSFLLQMGRRLRTVQSIGPIEALSWYFHDPETRIHIRKPALDCPEQFRRLFELRFSEQFPNGIALTSAWTNIDVRYRPASASFGGEVRLTVRNVPDLASQTLQRDKIRIIAEACSNELGAFSRWVLNNYHKRDSQEALALLPAELLREDASPMAAGLRAELDGLLVDEGMALIPTMMLLDTAGITRTEKFGKAEAVKAIQFLEKLGYGVEPDVRFGGATLKPAGTCVLFKLGGDYSRSPSPHYLAIQSMLQLAVIVVHADDTSAPEEEGVLKDFIKAQPTLTEAEQNRLMAHLKWILQEPPKLEKLRKHFASLVSREGISSDARLSLGKFLVSVAGADGTFAVGEIKALLKVFESVGLKEDELYGLINSHSTESHGLDDEPAPIILPSSTAPSFSVPGMKEALERFTLNENLIQHKMAETAAVSSLLNSIFAEDATPSSPTAPLPPSTSIWGLDSAHSALLTRLSTSPFWTREQFESLATSLRLLPEGALDRINEAAIEMCGIAVCDGEETIEVNLGLLKGVCSE
jgi:uncharacterized tellurite resistance protein B-like protein